MLRLMRDYATSWMIKIILGAIVVVFVFWGVGSFRNRKASVIASVNDSVVTLEEYNDVYKSLLEQMRQRFGRNLNQDLLKMLRIDQQALDQIINNRVILQEAERLNIRVTDQEVVDSIKEIPAFQSNGRFDAQQYRRVLTYNRLQPEAFEESQKNNLLVQKVQALIFSNVHVSEGEALAYYQWENASVDIEYVLFDPQNYEPEEPTADELRAAYEENKETYRTEPRVKVRYLHFDPQQYKDRVTVSAAEVEDYFYANSQRFETPKTVEARHILIKVDADATEKAAAEAKERALEILQKYREGASFEELAKTYSEGPSGPEGGYLGAFRKGDMVPRFSEKAFSMSAGEVSEPVRTQFGWHLIKVEKVNAASKRSLEAAESEIRSTLTEEKAKLEAYDAAESFFNRTFEGDDISTIPVENAAVETSGYFTKKGPEQGIASPRRFAAAAFDLLPTQISDVLELEDGYYILQVVDKKPGVIPELAAVQPEVRADLIAERQDALAGEDAEKLLQQLKTATTNAADVPETGALSFKTTGFFGRNAEIPGIGYENAIARAAFELTPENPLPPDVIKGGKGYYVIRFRERRVPDEAAFATEKESIVQKLMDQKRRQAFEAWLAEMKNRSEITIREGFLQTQ